MPIADEKYKRLTDKNVGKAPRRHGVYALYDNSRTMLYLGLASGEGVTIRAMLEGHLAGRGGMRVPGVKLYKRETTPKPRARGKDLLEEHKERFGALPRFNAAKA